MILTLGQIESPGGKTVRIDVECLRRRLGEGDGSVHPDPGVVQGIAEIDKWSSETERSCRAVVTFCIVPATDLKIRGGIDQNPGTRDTRWSTRQRGIHPVIGAIQVHDPVAIICGRVSFSRGVKGDDLI